MDVKMHYFLSHPQKAWYKHIQEVEGIAKKKGAPLDKRTERMLEIIIRSHDFGKLTDFFQKKMQENDRKDILEARHSLYSAIFAAFWAFQETSLTEQEVLLIFNIVAHHHSNLSYLMRLLPHGSQGKETIEELQNLLSLNTINPSETQALFIQFRNQQWNRDKIIETFLVASPNDKEVITSFLDSYQSIIRTLYHLRKCLNKFFLPSKRNDDFFILHQFLYSLLVDSDILSASDTGERINVTYSAQDVQKKRTEYLISKDTFKEISEGRQQLNVMRTQVFNTVMDTIPSKVKQNGIYTITSPCGSGKTITGFSAAVEIRELLMQQDQKDRKVIYCLPFTTLITQNTEVVEHLLPLSEDMSIDKRMAYILQHHYLTPYVKEKEQEIQKEKILLENWNSSVVITTFVQLFGALIGHRKRSLKKLNSLRNAVVILDEVQSLHFRYWRFISYLFELYAKELGITFVIMTATKPEICKNSAIELLPSYQAVFRMVNRTKIIPVLDIRYTIKDLVCQRIRKSIQITNKHHLIVMNTINGSMKLFNELTKYYNEEQLYYLSTNITPHDRKQVVDDISDKLKQNELPIILVSTQVIEAGVDVDFDVVYREIAPLDSIIQTSGRGNRNNEKLQAPVYIFMLENETEKIYNDVLITLTKKLFEGKKEIEEVHYLELIQEYFSLVSQKTNDDFRIFHKYVQNLQHNEKGKGLCEFQLIEEGRDAITVLVQQTREIVDLYSIYKTNQSRMQREVMGKKLQEYMIAIQRKYCDSIPYDEETGFYVIYLSQLQEHYDGKTGIIRK